MRFLLIAIMVAFAIVVFEVQILDIHSDIRKHRCEQVVDSQGHYIKASQYEYDACIAGERK